MSGAGKSLITPQKGAKPRSKNWATHGSVTTQETAEALRKERNRLQAEKMLQPKEPLRTDVRTLPAPCCLSPAAQPAALTCGSVVFW